MRAPRVYIPQPLAAATEVTLPPAPSHHLLRVLRLNIGDPLVVFNGAGGEYRARLTAADKKAATVQLEEFFPGDQQSPLQVHLGIALSKGDRFDWVLQKATELGVTAITPLISERVEVRLKGERLEKKRQHWHGVVVSACEQCGRNRLPELAPPQPLDTWLNHREETLKLVLHHRNPQNLPNTPVDSLALLIGPEGGLSTEEIQRAEQLDFHAWQLGPRVLRTETAPLAALAIVQARWGDIGEGTG